MQGVYAYNDDLITFSKECIKKIPYMKDLKRNDLYDMIFSLRVQQFYVKQVLQSIDEEVTTLYFLDKGVIEVSIILDGQKIVNDKLYKGSIINHRTFFLPNYYSKVQL